MGIGAVPCSPVAHVGSVGSRFTRPAPLKTATGRRLSPPLAGPGKALAHKHRFGSLTPSPGVETTPRSRQRPGRSSSGASLLPAFAPYAPIYRTANLRDGALWTFSARALSAIRRGDAALNRPPLPRSPAWLPCACGRAGAPAGRRLAPAREQAARQRAVGSEQRHAVGIAMRQLQRSVAVAMRFGQAEMAEGGVGSHGRRG